MEIALITDIQTLRLAIGTQNSSTPATLLTGVPCRSIFYFDSFRHPFVFQELFKLEKVPFVQLSSLFLSHLRVSNSGQLFQNYCASFVKRIYNLFGNCMINIPTKPLFLGFDFAKVPFAGMFLRLKHTSNSLIPMRNCFNLLSTKEFVSGKNCKLFDAPVNTNENIVGWDISNFFLKYNVEKYFSIFHKQICGSILPSQILFKIFRNNNAEFLSSVNSGERSDFLIKPKRIGIDIVPNTSLFGLRTSSLLMFFDNFFNRDKRFSSFLSCGTGKLRGQEFFAFLIRFVMKRDSVGINGRFGLKTYFTNKIIGLGVGINSRLELFWRTIYNKFCCLNQFHIFNSIRVIIQKSFKKVKIFFGVQEKGGSGKGCEWFAIPLRA